MPNGWQAILDNPDYQELVRSLRAQAQRQFRALPEVSTREAVGPFIRQQGQLGDLGLRLQRLSANLEIGRRMLETEEGLARFQERRRPLALGVSFANLGLQGIGGLADYRQSQRAEARFGEQQALQRQIQAEQVRREKAMQQQLEEERKLRLQQSLASLRPENLY